MTMIVDGIIRQCVSDIYITANRLVTALKDFVLEWVTFYFLLLLNT